MGFYVKRQFQGTGGRHHQRAALEQRDRLMIHHFYAEHYPLLFAGRQDLSQPHPNWNQGRTKVLLPMGAIVRLDPHEQ